MNSAIRLSCWAAVVGAALEILAVLVAAFVSPGKLDPKTAQSGAYIGMNFVSAVGALLLLYGLPGLSARWGDGWGRMGLAGVALLGLALTLIVFFSLIAGTFLSWLAVKAPALFSDPSSPPFYAIVSIILFAATIAGDVLLAIPILRRGAGPRWVGFVLIASAALFFVYVAAAAARPNVPLALVGSLGPGLLCVALGYLGYVGASSSRRPAT